MQKGAEILVNTCANIRKGDKVVIVSDKEHMPITDELKKSAEKAGGIVKISLSPPRSIDNEEPVESVAGDLKNSDAAFLVVTHALAHTKAVKDAIGCGTRVVSMTAFTEGMMKSGGLFTDFKKQKPLCDKLADELTNAKIIKVTNNAGTNLRMSVESRSGNSHACIVDKPGFTAVPNIEANIAPMEGTSEGILVVDGSIPYYGVGVIDQPVYFEIEKGFVTSIKGGEQAKFLDELLKKQNDPNVYAIAQFAIGLNPDCKDFTGEMLNDEGVFGTIHIGIGTSSNLGGDIRAKTHFDAIIRKPSVWFDDRQIIDEGEIATGHS